MMYDLIIVGAGPAGVSASLYAVRGGLSVLVLYKNQGALEKAEKIENYYGFPDGITGPELQRRGVLGAKRLGVCFKEAEVVRIGFADTLDHFEVETASETLPTKAIILATGSQRQAPPIQNLSQLEGHGVSYCAVCDAFFYRGKDVAVLGSGEYALHEAQVLLQTSRSVTLFTDGQKPAVPIPDTIAVCTKKIAALQGSDHVEAIQFTDGTSQAVAGVFVAYGVAGSADLARKIGAPVQDNTIVVDENQATLVPGLFAAGDTTGGLLQVAKAVYEGAKAGLSAIHYLKKQA